MDVTEIICKSTVHFCAVYFIATFLCAHLRKNSIFHTPSISNKKKGVTQLFLLCWYCIFYRDFKERTFRLEHSTWTTSLWLNYCTPLTYIHCVLLLSQHSWQVQRSCSLSHILCSHWQIHSTALSNALKRPLVTHCILSWSLSLVMLFERSKRPFWNGSASVFNSYHYSIYLVYFIPLWWLTTHSFVKYFPIQLLAKYSIKRRLGGNWQRAASNWRVSPRCAWGCLQCCQLFVA